MSTRSVSRRSNSNSGNGCSSLSKPEHAASHAGHFSSHSSAPKSPRHSSGRQGQHNSNSSRNDIARKNASQKQPRQFIKGKQSNSNQRPQTKPDFLKAFEEDANNDSLSQQLAATPTKKSPKSARKHNSPPNKQQQQQQPKVTLLTKSASESEQQSLLAKFAAPSASDKPATSRPVAKRSRRRQASPPRLDDDPGLHPVSSSPIQPAALHSAPPASNKASYQQQQQVHTPTRRPPKQQQAGAGSQTRPLSGPIGGIYSPTPRAAHPATPVSSHAVALPRVGSPAVNKSNHYAGASFNNSPAPSTLPLPPSFLTAASPTMALPTAANAQGSAIITRDEDVFGVAPSGPVSPEQLFVRRPAIHQTNAASALSERSRQLEDMLLRGNVIHQAAAVGANGPPATAAAAATSPVATATAGTIHSYSSVDLTQPATELSAMFQKLRLIKEMSQTRPATVSPVSSNRVLASAYNA
ncbi:hypothetical protein GGI12_000002 [Dipsacomyces acuminosporus]|nr:hypothetical protein GGI12_000002 [Dipsacomyces acuminosporus]